MPFHLKDRLKLLRTKTLPSHPDFFVLAFSYNEPSMVTTSAKICAAFSNIVPKEPRMEELKEVYDAIIKFYQDHQGFEGIPKRLLRKSSWVIFKEVDDERPPLIGVGKLNTALLKHIQITAISIRKASKIKVMRGRVIYNFGNINPNGTLSFYLLNKYRKNLPKCLINFSNFAKK